VIEYPGDASLMQLGRPVVPGGRRWKGWLAVATESGAPTFWFFAQD
jgi:hypothetical protein